MAVRLWRRKGTSEITEALDTPAPASTVQRLGYDASVPRGGLQGVEITGVGGRSQHLEDLLDAYLGCLWSHACVDAVAKTTTAGGIQLHTRSEPGTPSTKQQALPAAAAPLQRLIDTVNPAQDIRQLMMGVIEDLQIFGDSFVEVVWWLGIPVALYPLACPTMRIKTDPHGNLLGYAQVLDATRRVTFEEHEVIHISLGGRKGSIYGVGPTEKNLAVISAWVYTEALCKEMARKGNPPRLHANAAQDVSEPDITRWLNRYLIRNLGIPNLGTPIITKGINLTELSLDKFLDLQIVLNLHRDAICSGYGTPPAEVDIIESGNLGGGTGTSQNKSYMVNTCAPYGNLAMEKFNYALTWEGFNLRDVILELGDFDWRDDAVVETIRKTRVERGGWTPNKYREDIGEPPVEGGDIAMIVLSRDVIAVEDMGAMSKAALAKASGTPPEFGADGNPTPTPPKESGPRSAVDEAAALQAAWNHDFQARRRQALKELPKVTVDA